MSKIKFQKGFLKFNSKVIVAFKNKEIQEFSPFGYYFDLFRDIDMIQLFSKIR